MTNLFFRGTVTVADPHYFGKLDTDPHLSENSGALEVQNGAVEADDANNDAQPLK
jgi:aspartate 1-decarboxylase